MLTQTSVLARPGWSKGVLAQLLGEPERRFLDEQAFQLYILSRVLLQQRIAMPINHYKQVLLIGNPLPPKPL